ncbi:MAG: hypothetical protein VZR28_10760 [Candidatus Cryptobacteroides sp.]|nr:hypothetical protein [Candidatus Cryptobacteroides sp.]
MSELKAYQVICTDDIDRNEITENFSAPDFLAYDADEADKVIAELKADYKEACDRLQTANLIKDEQLAATRHHKYKRCLAMAKWCESRRIDAANYRIPRQKWDFYDKWHKRWLELAKKFKFKEA